MPDSATLNLDPVERVEQYCRRAIATAKPGDRLPSVRQVMQDCHASRTVVDRTLSRLQGEGLLEARKRSGLYCIGEESQGEQFVDLLYCGYPEGLRKGGFQPEFISCMLAEATEQSQHLRVRQIPLEEDGKSIMMQIARMPDAQVVAYNTRVDNLPTFDVLRRRNVPFIHVLPNIAEPVTPCLMVHDETLVRQQIEHLLERGHRRIAFLHSVREDKFSRPTKARRDAFYRLAVELSLDVQPGWVPFVGWEPDRIRRTLHEILQRDVRPTALIIYDEIVSHVYAELYANGLTPGKDVSVVGTNDIPGVENLAPPLTSQRIPRSRLARMALQALKRLKDGETIGVEYVETGIVVRESTSYVNE